MPTTVCRATRSRMSDPAGYARSASPSASSSHRGGSAAEPDPVPPTLTGRARNHDREAGQPPRRRPRYEAPPDVRNPSTAEQW
jgi:hypothetical protein